MDSKRYGLLHLVPVPENADRGDLVGRNLRTVVREVSTGEAGMKLDAMERAEALLSFYAIHDSIFIVRVANVNYLGHPFTSLSEMSAVYDSALARCSQFAKVLEDGAQYDHFYHPGIFIHTEYLFVPNNKYVRSFVVALNIITR